MRSWILITIFCLVLTIPNITIGETIYYVSPEGSDAYDGVSSSYPWKTFKHAIPRLQPGDTLIVLDGVYTAVPMTTGLPNISCGQGGNASNGTETQPITIRAENERRALLQSVGNYQHAFYMNNCSHWNMIGLRGQSADLPTDQGGKPYSVFAIFDSDHIALKRLLATHPNRYGNSQAIQLSGCANSLVEECEAYYFHRHGISIYQSKNITVRRCYVNSRGYADLPGSGFFSHKGAEERGDEGITLYWTTDSIIENCISEGNEFFGNSGQRNHYLGSISLDNLYGFVVGHHCCEEVMEAKDNFYIDNVAIGSKYHGFLTQSDINPFIDRLTSTNNGYYGLFANNKYSDNHNSNLSWHVDPSLTVQNSLFLNNQYYYGISINHAEDYEFRKLEYLNSYGHKQNYGPGTAVIKNGDRAEHLLEKDPQLGSCMVFIPKDSPLKGAGKDEADIGANILYRYQDGILTNQPLWTPQTGAFPCGEVVQGLNDLPGSSCFDVHQRLNVNANGCSLAMAGIPPVNHAPIAEAGNPQTVKEGVRVVLDGMRSYDPDEGDRIEAYRWRQVAGPSVTLSEATSAQPYFTAPGVAQGEVLRFELIVNDGQLDSMPDYVDIKILPQQVPKKLTLRIRDGTPTWPGEGWDNAIDGDLEGWDGTASPGMGTAYCIFGFADGLSHQINKIRILVDTKVGWEAHWIREFSVEVSEDGTSFSPLLGRKGAAIADWKGGRWQEYTFDPIPGKYVKLVIHEPKWDWKQVGEFEVWGFW